MLVVKAFKGQNKARKGQEKDRVDNVGALGRVLTNWGKHRKLCLQWQRMNQYYWHNTQLRSHRPNRHFNNVLLAVAKAKGPGKDEPWLCFD